jgi:hypothetical protein
MNLKIILPIVVAALLQIPKRDRLPVLVGNSPDPKKKGILKKGNRTRSVAGTAGMIKRDPLKKIQKIRGARLVC